MEKVAYLIKHRFPGVFGLIERLAQFMTILRYGRRISAATNSARVDGHVGGRLAVMRALGQEDLHRLHIFLEALPPEHTQYFRPHGFDLPSLKHVLTSRAFLNFGLFVEDDLVGYALLKVAPTGSAFIGRVLRPDFVGKGLGSFFARFLYWQASLAGLRARSTISRSNTASLRSHQAVADYKIVAELPDDYLLIEFPVGNPAKPVLGSR